MSREDEFYRSEDRAAFTGRVSSYTDLDDVMACLDIQKQREQKERDNQEIKGSAEDAWVDP